jgi:hypothetical protein
VAAGVSGAGGEGNGADGGGVGAGAEAGGAGADGAEGCAGDAAAVRGEPGIEMVSVVTSLAVAPASDSGAITPTTVLIGTVVPG